jgi:hypothetical protein
MQRTHNARTVQRLRRTKFFAQRHKAGHFGFGNVDFFTAKIGLAYIGNDIIVKSHRLILREVSDNAALSGGFPENQI